MTKEELKKLDTELEAEEKILIKRLREIAVENPAVKGDFEPSMPSSDDLRSYDEGINASTELDANFAIERELEKQLEGIRSARERIKNQSYGICSNCQNRIEEDRIKVIPTAALCINCAQTNR
ncbi:MAG: TraR/DksA C4-type zinc finger protein [Candidatus Yanofskybacteria bacterium]|nr:TraR/DksA C4-type zinc finger protein [Candidatus Yanofskybacteria bacterium]